MRRLLHTMRNGTGAVGLLLLTMVVALTMTGCKPALIVVTVTPVPTKITVQPPTLPPSWTPGPTPTTVLATNTPVVTFQSALGAAGLSALPPTWTPAPVRTDTPVPIVTATEDSYRLTLTAFLPQSGPTINPTTPAPPTQEGTAQPPQSPYGVTFAATCLNFVADTKATTRIMVLGNDALVVWKQIPEATAYHVWLATSDGFYRYNVTVTGDRVTIPAKEFLTAGSYGWELVAYSSYNPICGHQSGVIVVRNG